ncbi:MAG: fasciclin domain-containing protein [Bacteroidaceae bacterium]|nr:fasciclin domain-containing protein [Bacteroidaceae bacterium]
METIRKFKNRTNLVGLFLMVFIVMCMASGCSEQVDTSARYVFKENTIISYLESHPNDYSTYVNILNHVPVSSASATTLKQLLSARGNYTVFAPTNKAIEAYLDTLVHVGVISYPSWDAFTDSLKLDSVRRVIACNSIIDSGDNERAFETSMFPNKSGNEFALANMLDNKFTVYYGSTIDSILIYNKYPINIRNRDILVLNGVIHQMESVIAPRVVTAADYLQEIIEKQANPYLVMSRVLRECGLFDTLRAIRDEVYEQLYQTNQIENLPSMTGVGFHEGNIAAVPQHRKYGFTIFAEKDEFWKNQGIDPSSPNLFSQLTQWILDKHQYSDDDKFVTDNNYRSPDHLLYQWVTYHLLPMKIPSNKLVIHHNEYGYNLNNNTLGIPFCEFYTTMGQRRLLKIYESKSSDGVCLNRFPTLDNARNGSYQEISCDPDKVGCRVLSEDPDAVLSGIVNCNIYPIEGSLAYTDAVRNNLMRNRIRFDGMSLFPEAMNNDIRKKESTSDRYQHVYIPSNNVYQYFQNMWVNEGSHFVYYNAYKYAWPCLNADEMKAVGRYELTFKLPPVPRAGVYELRYGFNGTDYRGIIQTYFGNSLENMPASGIPIDLRTLPGWETRWGYIEDTDDIDYNAEVDKRMRNLGYMKGANSNCVSGNSALSARNIHRNGGYLTIRRILLREFLEPDQTYYVRMKSLIDSERKEFQLDYFEYCAKEVYDNPEKPEDIW